MVRLVLGGLGGPGGWVVLGTVISGFFSVPGGPPVLRCVEENKKSLRGYLLNRLAENA